MKVMFKAMVKHSSALLITIWNTISVAQMVKFTSKYIYAPIIGSLWLVATETIQKLIIYLIHSFAEYTISQTTTYRKQWRLPLAVMKMPI